MTVRLKLGLVFASAVLVALVSIHAQQSSPRQAQPIQFSQPWHNTATSNLNDFSAQKPTYLNPGKEFNKPSDIFDEQQSPGTITPPLRQLPPPNVSSKRLKELLDKRNDKAFETPEALETALTAEEIFKIPEFDRDGREKEKKTWMERAYDRLEREQLGSTNQFKGDEFSGRQKDDERRDDLNLFGLEKMPGSAEAPSLTPKPLFGRDAGSLFSADMIKSVKLPDGFGFANVESPEVKRARETRLENYRQLLDVGQFKPQAPTGPGLNPLKDMPTTTRFTPSTGMDPFPGAARSSLPTTSILAPQGLPASPASSQNFTPPPPRTPLPPPIFEMPKRKF